MAFSRQKEEKFKFSSKILAYLKYFSYLCTRLGCRALTHAHARMMTKEEKVAYWLDIADYDLETAEAMYKTKRWLYVAFMCHQVIEKTIKAYWSANRDDLPPYVHNHMRLANDCGLYEQMDEAQKTFLEVITNYNIEARYPENKAALARTLSPKVCRDIIDQTKQLQQWIKEKL